MQKVEQHIPALDGIRGLAILLVLFIHIGECMPTPLPGSMGWNLFFSLASSSWVGVDLFFVLSGFLITGILYDTRGASNYFRAFYVRRFLRIFPLYYGFLFLLLILTIPLHIEWRGREWIYLLYLQNTHIVKNVQSAAFSPYFKIDHLWSLAVEEQFYCVWPALVFWVKDRVHLIRLTAMLMLVSTLIRLLMLYEHKSLWMIYIFTPARADSLMMGSMLVLLFRCGGQVQLRLRRSALFVLPACLLVLIILALPTHGLRFSSTSVIGVGYSTIALASASLMTLSLTSVRIGAAINRPVLRWLGRYSYGIYVLHLPFMMLFLHLQFVNRIEGLSLSVFWKLGVVVLSEGLSIGLAFLSFKFYESRFLRLKRYFHYELPEINASPGDNVEAVLRNPEPAQS